MREGITIGSHYANQSDLTVWPVKRCVAHHQRMTVSCMMPLHLRLFHSGRMKKEGTCASHYWHWGEPGSADLGLMKSPFHDDG